eukprot:TRINITY_DN716_c0_g1_i3.p1 TRINITY_DN716_c0_g1~~TRINITY_DN716_c0_g1_i3.p1  ORF type:complete len:262 (+),score=29.79 TRINITY_DN716_c0_g1_i3:147-932(+)
MKPSLIVSRLVAGKYGNLAVASLQKYRSKRRPNARSDLEQLLCVVSSYWKLDEDEFFNVSREAITHCGSVARVVSMRGHRERKKGVLVKLQTFSPSNYHPADIIEIIYNLYESRLLQKQYLEKAIIPLRGVELSKFSKMSNICTLAVALKTHSLPSEWVMSQIDCSDITIEVIRKLGLDVASTLKRTGLTSISNKSFNNLLSAAAADKVLWRCFEEHVAAYGLKSMSTPTLERIIIKCHDLGAKKSILLTLAERRVRERYM